MLERKVDERDQKKEKILTPFERILKAITFSKPDRVPVLFFPEFDLLADFAGKKVKQYLQDVDLQIETNEKFKARFPGAFCGVSIYQPYASAQAFGCKISNPLDDIPAVTRRLIEDPREIESLIVPEPWDADGTRQWLEKIQHQIDRGFQIASIGEFGPLEIAGQLYGYDRLLLDMRKHPDLVHALLRKTTDFVIKFQSEWAKVIGGRAAILFIADHVSGFMNRSLIEEFFGKYHKELIEALKPRAGAMFYHSENRSDHFIDLIGAWGYSMFHGQDWAPKGELKKTKEIVSCLQKKYCLVGQVPGRDVMLREADDKVVERKIIENIQIYAPGSGYVLSTGGGINRGTPLSRLDMMVNLADKYGRFKSKKELFGLNE